MTDSNIINFKTKEKGPDDVPAFFEFESDQGTASLKVVNGKLVYEGDLPVDESANLLFVKFMMVMAAAGKKDLFRELTDLALEFTSQETTND